MFLLHNLHGFSNHDHDGYAIEIAKIEAVNGTTLSPTLYDFCSLTENAEYQQSVHFFCGKA
jgi:hypothetical protein